MPENLTLATYLERRGSVKALTRIEAEVFGVPYPLVKGWAYRHGGAEITQAMLDQLQEKIGRARSSTAERAQRGLNGVDGGMRCRKAVITDPVNGEAVLPRYEINLVDAELHAKRLLRMCSNKNCSDVEQLFHALHQIDQAFLDQAIFDPALPLWERQVHLKRLLNNIAFVKVLAISRPQAFEQFPRVREELGPLFKLTKKLPYVHPNADQAAQPI